jgi:hypothetical protein
MEVWNYSIITAIAAILFSLSAFANVFAETSGADNGGGDKSKSASDASGHKTGDSNGGNGDGMSVPGVPVVRADQQKNSGNNDGEGGVMKIYGHSNNV